jgi:hypothetical protein
VNFATPFFTALLLAAPMVGAQETYGTIRATTKLRPDGSTSTTVVDPDKRTAEETITDAGGKPLRKTTYLLGDRDLAIGAIFADAKGKVIYKVSYQRDGYGHVVESSFTGPEGQYLGKRIFVFGAGDTVTRMEDYDAKGQLIGQPQTASPATTTVKKKRR